MRDGLRALMARDQPVAAWLQGGVAASYDAMHNAERTRADRLQRRRAVLQHRVEQWQAIAARYDKLAIVYRGAALLHATLRGRVITPAVQYPQEPVKSETDRTAVPIPQWLVLGLAEGH